MLKQLMAAGTRYVKEMELEDMAALKICLIALGALLGLAVPKRSRKPAAFMAAFLFVFTWVPVMCKFLVSLTRVREEQ